MTKESNLGAILNAQSALELLRYADLHKQHFITQVHIPAETRLRAPCNCHISKGQQLFCVSRTVIEYNSMQGHVSWLK